MKRVIYNMLTIFLVAGMLNNCASIYRQPESFSSKMSRFEETKRQNISVPNIEVSDSLITSIDKKKQSRKIASKKKENPLSHSNKRLYFLTLLMQYNVFRNYSQNSFPVVSSCPNFHTSLLNQQEQAKNISKSVKKITIKAQDTSKLNIKKYALSFPELHLPLSRNSLEPKAIDYLQNNKDKDTSQVIQKAIDLHISKVYDELAMLCEFGVSENYYQFENLVSFISNMKSFSPTPYNKGMLLKTTLISNFVIIKSLQAQEIDANRKISSKVTNNLYEKEVLYRLKSEWINDLIVQMLTKRENY